MTQSRAARATPRRGELRGPSIGSAPLVAPKASNAVRESAAASSEPCYSPSGDIGRQGQDAQAAARRSVLWLSTFSLVWMSGEGAVGLVASARTSSLSLAAWAVGSVIEGLASAIVLWRFTGARRVGPTAERRAQRAVALSFWLLAPYLLVEAGRRLAGDLDPGPTTLGMVVTGASVLLMPLLGLAKRRYGQVLGSGATSLEGSQNLMCAAQAFAVLCGLVVTDAYHLHWVDPVITIALAAWALAEGRRAWRGQACC